MVQGVWFMAYAAFMGAVTLKPAASNATANRLRAVFLMVGTMRYLLEDWVHAA